MSFCFPTQLLPSQNASGEPSLPRGLRAGRGQAPWSSEGLGKGADLPLGHPQGGGESGVTPTRTPVFAMHGSAHGLCCWRSVLEPAQGHSDHHSYRQHPWCAQLLVTPSLSGLVFFPVFGVFSSAHDKPVDKGAWFRALEQMGDVWVMSWEMMSYRSFCLGHEVSAH